MRLVLLMLTRLTLLPLLLCCHHARVCVQPARPWSLWPLRLLLQISPSLPTTRTADSTHRRHALLRAHAEPPSTVRARSPQTATPTADAARVLLCLLAARQLRSLRQQDRRATRRLPTRRQQTTCTVAAATAPTAPSNRSCAHPTPQHSPACR
jgi:hypothetical protein